MKHTPGPWTVEFDDYGGYDCMTSAYRVCAAGETVVGGDTNDHNHAENEDSAPNARLIAPRPDLYEALRAIAEMRLANAMGPYDMALMAVDRARAALAKVNPC